MGNCECLNGPSDEGQINVQITGKNKYNDDYSEAKARKGVDIYSYSEDEENGNNKRVYIENEETYKEYENENKNEDDVRKVEDIEVEIREEAFVSEVPEHKEKKKEDDDEEEEVAFIFESTNNKLKENQKVEAFKVQAGVFSNYSDTRNTNFDSNRAEIKVEEIQAVQENQDPNNDDNQIDIETQKSDRSK